MASPQTRRVQSASRPRAALMALACTVSATMILGTGCGPAPSAANIALRKENQALRDKLQTTENQSKADREQLEVLQRDRTIQSLPQSELSELFTATDIDLGKLTGAVDLDSASPGNEGLRVYVVPKDQNGDVLKAAGTFHVELFDLKQKETRLGAWDFDAGQSRASWRSFGPLYNYVLDCPWQQIPTHGELTINVVFTDALTHRTISKQKVINVDLAAISQSAVTQPATRPSTTSESASHVPDGK